MQQYVIFNVLKEYCIPKEELSIVFCVFFCTIVCLYLDPIDRLSTRDNLCLNVYKTMKLPEMTMNIY